MRGNWMLLCALVGSVALSGCAAPPANQLASGCPAPGLDPSSLAQRKAYDCEGKYYLQRGKYQHAIDNFTMAIQADPNNAKSYANRATAYRALGQTTAADADLARARQLDPTLAGV